MRITTIREFCDNATQLLSSKEPVLVTRRGRLVGLFVPLGLGGRQKISDDEAEQARLHREAAKWIGSISGDIPNRAESARQAIRERLRKRYARPPAN